MSIILFMFTLKLDIFWVIKWQNCNNIIHWSKLHHYPMFETCFSHPRDKMIKRECKKFKGRQIKNGSSKQQKWKIVRNKFANRKRHLYIQKEKKVFLGENSNKFFSSQYFRFIHFLTQMKKDSEQCFCQMDS